MMAYSVLSMRSIGSQKENQLHLVSYGILVERQREPFSLYLCVATAWKGGQKTKKLSQDYCVTVVAGLIGADQNQTHTGAVSVW